MNQLPLRRVGVAMLAARLVAIGTGFIPRGVAPKAKTSLLEGRKLGPLALRFEDQVWQISLSPLFQEDSKAHKVTFVLASGEGTAMTLKAAGTSCGCLRPTRDVLVLEPYRREDFDLDLDLKRRSGLQRFFVELVDDQCCRHRIELLLLVEAAFSLRSARCEMRSAGSDHTLKLEWRMCHAEKELAAEIVAIRDPGGSILHLGPAEILEQQAFHGLLSTLCRAEATLQTATAKSFLNSAGEIEYRFREKTHRLPLECSVAKGGFRHFPLKEPGHAVSSILAQPVLRHAWHFVGNGRSWRWATTGR